MGRLAGRVVSEEDTDRGRKQEPAENCRKRNRRRPSGHHRDRLRERDSGENASQAAAHAQEHSLGKKLQENMETSGTDGHAQPDLAGPLCHRDQQDVHDADAADEERNRRDGGKQQRHDVAAALRGLGDLAEVPDGEITDTARRDTVAPV